MEGHTGVGEGGVRRGDGDDEQRWRDSAAATQQGEGARSGVTFGRAARPPNIACFVAQSQSLCAMYMVMMFACGGESS